MLRSLNRVRISDLNNKNDPYLRIMAQEEILANIIEFSHSGSTHDVKRLIEELKNVIQIVETYQGAS